MTESSFDILVDENCVDLVDKLLELDDAYEHWVNHFKKRSNVVKICESKMSKDMVLAISKKSEKFYIIPRNGSSKEQTSMYGAFIYFLREKGQEGVINSLLDGRAEEIKELMRDAGFKELLNSFDPSSWKLSTLLEDIKSMLDDHSSSISMLFLSFYTHGCNGYIQDHYGKYVNIDEILKIINGTPQLKKIPKVCIGICDIRLYIYNV